jgi:hypothetical protein
MRAQRRMHYTISISAMLVELCFAQHGSSRPPPHHSGLIRAPPGKAAAGLQAASRTIEAMVAAKAAAPELILLCLEDCNDWTHATTRQLVMQARIRDCLFSSQSK